MGKKLKLEVLKGDVLGVKVLRGFARLCDLSSVSKADIYDQKKNPTERNGLESKHAKEAYFYVKNNTLAFWPEVFLCIRNSKCYKFAPASASSNFGT
jgi:hypothetical protein